MGIIFDLDQTIIDSSIAKGARSSRNWDLVYSLIPQMKPYNKVVDFIKTVVNQGIEVAIVTSSPKAYCDRILSYLGISGVTTVCFHDTMNHKPNPEPLLLAINKMKNQENKRIIAVGDEQNDIIAANNANISSALACWGNPSAFVLEEVQPNYYFRDEDSLLHFFNSFANINLNIPMYRHKESNIYHLLDYYPKSRKHDMFSEDIFKQVKGFSESADILSLFANTFKALTIPYAERKNYGVFLVPSSKQGAWNNQLMKYVVPFLVNDINLKDCSNFLYRHTMHEKQAFGGVRSVQSHLDTIRLQYILPKDMIGAFIIDDITTTGNIFTACTNILEREGINRDNIYCIALAGTV